MRVAPDPRFDRRGPHLWRSETIEIPGVTSRMRYRLVPGGEEYAVSVAPSVIHYSQDETLIGDQVVSRGLAEHPEHRRQRSHHLGRYR